MENKTNPLIPGVIILEERDGYITSCNVKGPRPTTASLFAIGCIMNDLSEGKQYYNAGTIASPSWNALADITTTDIGDGQVTAAKLASTLDLSGKTVTLATGEISAAELASTLDLSGKTVTLATGEISAGELASTLDLSSKTVTMPNTSITAGMLAATLDLTGKDAKYAIKSGTPVNAVAASGTLTLSGTPLEGETVTIGTRIYEIDSDNSVTAGNVRVDVSGGAVAATGTLTLAGVVKDTETITIGARVYEIDANSSVTPGRVAVNVSAGTKVQAAGTLTLTNPIKDGETFTIGSEVYEIDTDGSVTGGRTAVDVSTHATASQGTLTLGGAIPANNDTCTVGATTYTWKTTLTGAANEIKRGSTVDDCIDNFVYAINDGPIGEGVLYGTGTTANASATAAKTSGTTAVLTAKTPGTVGDTVATTETFTDGANVFDAATLGTTTAGVDCSAANGDGVIISTFNGATALAITAAQGAGTTVDFTCDAAGALDGSAGNAVASTETLTNGSFGGATFSGGSDATASQAVTAIVSAITGDGSAVVTAVDGAGDTVDLTAKTEGTGGNSITTTETLANGSFGGATLSGGSDESAANTVTALVTAITNDGSAVVTAVDGAGDTVVVTSKIKGTVGNSYASTETGANMSWGGATLSGGVNGTVGAAREVYADATYLYITTAANTTADTNWRRIAIGSAY